jgi:protein-disulfide isomerase/uncharacterized membrane protein
MEKKGLTLQGLSGMHLLHIFNAIAMIVTGIYLTTHYYDTLYPTTNALGGGLCDINSFWNCDTTTHSPIAAILGVPLAFLGLLNGIMLLAASIFPSEAHEKTCSAISKYNALGTISLLLYSLVALGGLCPVCSIYYVLSWISAFLFIKFGKNEWIPDFKIVGIYAGILTVSGFGISQYTQGRAEKQKNIASQVVKQFVALAEYGNPEMASPFLLNDAGADAPIQVSIFSDFQCPSCKVASDTMPTLIRRYGNKLNIQYFFYPLDSNCNPSVKSQMHPYACRAAMLSACDPKKFVKVHDEIFENQSGMNLDVLQSIAEKNGLTECFDSQSTRDLVMNSINAGEKFNLRSTPTIIINGKKIEGSIPAVQFQAIFDEILRK